MRLHTYYLGRIPLAHWPIIVPVDADTPEHPATHQDLLNMGISDPVVDAVGGYVYVDCAGIDDDRRRDLHIEVVAQGFRQARAEKVPSTMRAFTHRASVIRSTTPGVNLREQAADAVARQLPARVPATGRTSTAPADPVGALEVLEEARRLTVPVIGANGEPGAVTARRVVVPVAEVLDGDVVEEDMLPRGGWFGEVDY